MASITRLIKNNKYYFFGFFVLVAVIFANAFPPGYVFSGGDTTQFIEAKDNLGRLFYAWEGRAFFYYAIFYLLDFLSISDSAQLSWSLGVFIFGSYISFGIFTKLLFNVSDRVRLLISLFYALNLYTLFLFTGNTGFSYYPTLYIFIPVLTGLFIKFLSSRDNSYGVWFVFSTLLASSGFGNIAFAFSFSIFLLLIAVFLVVVRLLAFDRKLMKKIIFIALFSFLLNAFWLWPVIPQMRGGVENLQNDNVLEFSFVIRHTASPILNTISMLYYSGDYFPNNFPYKKLGAIKEAFSIMAFLPITLIAFGFWKLKKLKEADRKMALAFGGVMLVMMMLIARVTPPFEIINRYVYGLWGMEVLRGFDKTGVFFPFLLAAILLMIAPVFEQKKWFILIVALVVLTPLPFFTGKIQQNMSYRFSGMSPEKKDFQKSKLSFLVKIPDEYYKIRKTINNDKEKVAIATLPYSSSDGSGISNYPKWKIYGTDITGHIYNKNMLVANKAHFPQWNYSETFSNGDIPGEQWLIKLLGTMDVKYIIYHKDAPEDAVSAIQGKIKQLEKEGLIENLEDNDYFTLYEIDKKYIIPYISWQNENINLVSNAKDIDRELDEVRNNYHPAEFQELNPKKFAVKKDNAGGELVFSERYDPNWKAYAIEKNGQETEIKDHFLARGYANGWKIPKNSNNVERIVIEYYPVRLLVRGIWISAAMALFLFIYLLVYYYGYKRDNTKNTA